MHLEQNSERAVSRKIMPPTRKRRRKPKALLALLTLFVLGLSLFYPEARFRYELRARHLRGEKLLPEDFHSSQLPDDENAATFLHQAAIRLKPSASEDRLTDNVSGRVLVPEQRRYVQELFAARPDAFELIRRARQCSDVNWPIRITSPVMKILLPHLNEQRSLTNILYLVAVCEHEWHDDRAAIETVNEMLFMARAVDHQPFLVSHLVSIGIEEMAFNACIRLAPSLAIAGDSGGPTGSAGIPRTQITALIDELLVEKPRQAALLAGWECDRMSMIDAARTKENPWILRYYLSWGIPEVLEQYDTARSASLISNWHQARAVLDAAHEPRFALASISHGSFARPIENHLMRLTECRVAATALAIRLYQLDHAGNYPRTLQELVPEYLPSLPLDPFSPDNKPLGLISGDPPSIYSVGVDEIDGHGDRTHAIDDEGIYRPWRAPDAVFPLGGVLLNEPWDPQH